MRTNRKFLSLILAIVMLFTFLGMTASVSAAPNSPPYPHVSVTRTVVQYYEESKFGLHGWQCESTAYTSGNIDWIIYSAGGGYWSTSTVTKTSIYEGFFHRYYWKTTTYKYFDYYGNSLPIH